MPAMPGHLAADESDRHPTDPPERPYTPLRTPLPVLPEAHTVDDRQLLQQVLAAVNSLTETVRELSSKVAFLESQIPNGLERKIDKIQASLSRGDASFAVMEQRINQLDKDVVAAATRVEQRVAQMEVRMSASEHDRAAIRTKLATLETEIRTLRDKAATDETHALPSARPQPHWALQAGITAVVTVISSATAIWWLQGIAQHAKP